VAVSASHIHVAIVSTDAGRCLTAGTKRIESRLYLHRRPPYDCIAPGDTVCFKLSGGQILAASSATRVLQFDNLTPQRIDRLHRRYNGAVCAPGRFWRARRHCRYGVLIWITDLRPAPPGLHIPRQYGTGWLTLPGGVKL
jgi:hypothetical protein